MAQEALWGSALRDQRPAEDPAKQTRNDRGLTMNVMSFPKAGRTWTTNLWYFYALAITGQDKYFVTDDHKDRPTDNLRFINDVLPLMREKGLARLLFSHGLRRGELANQVEHKIGERKYAVIVRRPSRILPSYYHHIKSRLKHYPDAARLTCVSDIVRSERYGIDRIIDYYNVFDQKPLGRFVVYYEDLLADTRKVFRNLLVHAGYKQISDAALDYAVEQSSFDRLQAVERAKRLAAGKTDHRNTLRYRVGGDGKGELTAEDEDFVAERLLRANVSLLNRYLT